ncbi:hypothetical protein QZH41_013163, partial [Actinostola sp. cb2023]
MAIQGSKNKPKSRIKAARPVASYHKMLSLLEHIYHDLDLIVEFKINVNILRGFLMCIQANYRNNPFHNFRHCFCVTQMAYSVILLCNLKELLSSLDILVLITTCICHDLDHPGCNNTYQINANTELSIRYNDTSPLENHHAATAFDILSQVRCSESLYHLCTTTVTSTQRSPPHNGHLYTTATSTQRPPLHNGHLYTTATSTQRSPPHNGHLHTTATSTQRPPLHNGHLYTTATSTQRPPLHNGHLYTTVTSTQRPPPHNGHLHTTATSTQRPPLHNGHLYTTATSTQRPPPHNGHLYTTVTSTQRPPLHNGHLYTTATSTQRPPPHNGHLYTTATSTQRPPPHNGHLYTTVTSTQRPPLHNGHLYTTVTSTQRPPLHNGHLYTTATSTQRPPLHNGHLYTTATSTQRSPPHNGHLHTTATSTQRSPPHNGHNGHLYTTATSTQREIVENFKSKLDSFDFKNQDYLNSLKMILIKCCDISNEVRPMDVSDPWVDCLLEEYFTQSDREKAEGLPVAPFMDRDKVTKATAQIGFIKFVLIPLFESLSKVSWAILGLL